MRSMFRCPSRVSSIRNRTTACAIVLLCALVCLSKTLCADETAPVLVVPAGPVTLDVAVALPDGVALAPAAAYQLVEVDHADVVVPAQRVAAIAPDGSINKPKGRLIASIPPREGAEGPRCFTLEPATAPSGDAPGDFRLKEIDDKSLGLYDADQPVLAYNHGVITKEDVPENDSRRSRACYVHPVWGLSGEVLTDDFPRDHYHHHGIFWSWPHVKIDGREYDLWMYNNIKDLFVGWLVREAGPVAATVGVENGWFVGDKKVMIERVWLRAYKPAGDSRALDIEFIWIPVDKPITLWGAGGKSYGGLTMRFAPKSRQDTLITVPSGPTTADLPNTPLAWADFTSKFGEHPEQSGAAVFVDPGHPDFPPTWLTRHYGPQCVGWPGIEPKTFEPGKPIRLAYRIWIHKTAVETVEIQRAYDGYQAATGVEWR